MDRRSLLKSIGGSTVLSTIAGKTSHSKGIDNYTATSSGVATPADGAMSNRDRRKYFLRMAEKHDEVVVDQTIGPSGENYTTDPVLPRGGSGDRIGTYDRRPSQKPGTIIWDKTDYTKIKDSFGRKVVDCDHYMALYETDVYNEDGDRYYFFWIWAAASSFDYWDFTGNVWKFHNYINVTDGGNVLTYYPDGDITRKGTPVSVSASVQGTSSGSGGGGVGASAGISGEFVLGANKVRPHPEKCNANENKLCTQWIGDYEGSTALNGTCSLKRDPYDVLRWEWSTYLKGGKGPKTI